MNMPDELRGSWVSCIWNFDAGQGHPHPGSAGNFPVEWAGGCVAECVDQDGDYLVLAHQSGPVRVVPFSAKKLPYAPLFSVGQKLAVRAGSKHSFHTASLKSLSWHFKEGAYGYILHGKSTRYQGSELESVE